VKEGGGGGWGKREGWVGSYPFTGSICMKVVSIRKLLVFKVQNDQQRERDSARAREREGWRVREIERENAYFIFIPIFFLNFWMYFSNFQIFVGFFFEVFHIVCFLCPFHVTGN